MGEREFRKSVRHYKRKIRLISLKHRFQNLLENPYVQIIVSAIVHLLLNRIF